MFDQTDTTQYHKSGWKKKREQILRRDQYTCQYYKRYGKRVDATMVHHIYPVDQYPQYAWCPWNLISLSNKAHEIMHDRVTGRLTKAGEELRRRTIPPPKG